MTRPRCTAAPDFGLSWRPTAVDRRKCSTGTPFTIGEVIEGGFEDQARRVLANLEAVLRAGGCTFADVVKATIYVTDLANFQILNTLYGEAMGDHRPARSTVQVAALPKGVEVEIDLIARIPG